MLRELVDFEGSDLKDLTVGLLYEIEMSGFFRDDKGAYREVRLFKWGDIEWDEGKEEVKVKPVEGKADRFNSGKPQLSFMLDAPNAMIGLCRTFEAGAKKYSRDNWKKGLNEKELLDCLMRHLVKAVAGEEVDEETKVDHKYHVLWNALVWAEQYGNIQEIGDGS